MKYFYSLVAFLLFAFSIHAQKLDAPKFGKGLFNLVGKDSTWTMKIGTRMQILAISNWESEDGELINPESNMLIRRARLKFDGYAFSPKLVYKIELGLSNRDISGVSQYTRNTPRYILDAVLKWNFYENFVLWFGQTKLPGNRERVISSANMQQVDRSLLNSYFNIDRDMGFQLRHKTNLSESFIIKEIFAFSQGEGRNVTNGNLGGHQYTGRIELLPFGNFKGKGDYTGSDLQREESPKLAIGVTFDHNNDAVKTRSNLGSYMETDSGLHETNIDTWFVDGMFKYQGYSLMFEYADRTAADPIARNSDGSVTGDVVLVGNSLNVQTGYLFKNNLELSGRFTDVSFNNNLTGRSDETQYTLGLSRYLEGHSLKVQTDLSYLNVQDGNDELMFRLQVDIHF